MVMILNEEQQLLKDSAKLLLSENAPMSALRAMRDAGDDHMPELWSKMSEAGWPGIVIPDAYSGLEFGYVGAGVVLEEMGRTLALSPFLSSAVVAASLINQLGSEQQKEKYLPGIAAGELTAVLAADETGFFDLSTIETTASASGDDYVLSGNKRGVIDGHNADLLLVVTGGDAGMSVFAVESGAEGVSSETRLIVDSQRAADITLDNVTVSGDALLGSLGGASQAMEFTIDVAAACSAAEMLGISIETFERTVGYLKEREQFGRPLAANQLIQKKLVNMQTEIAIGLQAVLKVGREIENKTFTPEMISLVKRNNSLKALQIARDARDIHGGNGISDEYHVIRHCMNLEAVNTYEGTEDIHALILGRNLTDISAF